MNHLGSNQRRYCHCDKHMADHSIKTRVLQWEIRNHICERLCRWISSEHVNNLWFQIKSIVLSAYSCYTVVSNKADLLLSAGSLGN